MITATMFFAILAAAPPQFPPDPTLYFTDSGWCVLDTLPDGTGLVADGTWWDLPLLLAAMAPDPKPSPIAECSAAAVNVCGQGQVCWVRVTGDECSFGCRDAQGDCPPVTFPPPAAPPGTAPTKPPSTPVD